MAIEIVSTKREVHYVKCMVYGESGVGKTYLLSTAPNPLIISAEEGLLSLASMDLPVIEVKSMIETNAAFKYAKTSEYDTICLDSLSELGEVLLEEFKQEEKDPRKAYLRMGEELTRFMRKLRSLEKHVVVLVKQGVIKDELLGKITYAPGVPGQAFATQVPYFLDLLFCLRVEKGGNRFLQTQPNLQYMAKDRSGKLEQKEEPNLTKIFDKIVEKK